MKSLSSLKTTTILLPAAGWGSRMGYPNSKEVLTNPQTGLPYIEYALTAVKDLDAHIVVITRSEKTDLIEWIQNYRKRHPETSIELFLVTCTQEWPDTLLKTKSIWTEYNLVLLPDTDWKPIEATVILRSKLESNGVVYAVFNTLKKNWGFVRPDSNELSLIEKPTQVPDDYKPWGFFGFKKQYGQEILQAHLESTIDHSIKRIAIRSSELELQEFSDRTRGE